MSTLFVFRLFTIIIIIIIIIIIFYLLNHSDFFCTTSMHDNTDRTLTDVYTDV